MRCPEPLLRERMVVVCHRDIAGCGQDRSWPAGFAGLRSGNSAGRPLRRKAFLDPVAAGRITLEESRGTGSNLRKLASKRIDCYVDDRAAIPGERAAGSLPAFPGTED